MSRNEEAPRPGVQRNFQEVPGVQAEDWPAIGSQVAHLGQCRGDGARRLERGGVEEMVHLPGCAVAFVNGGDLRRQQEPDFRPAAWRQGAPEPGRELRLERQQPRLRGHQQLGKLGRPGGMSEIACADDR